MNTLSYFFHRLHGNPSLYRWLLIAVVAIFISMIPEISFAQTSNPNTADPYNFGMDKENVKDVNTSLISVWKMAASWTLILSLPMLLFVIFVLKGRGLLWWCIGMIVIVGGLPFIRFIGSISGIDTSAFN